MTSTIAKTIGLLILSNLFMTVAWYAHLKNLGHRSWFVAATLSWGGDQPVKLDYLWAALCILGAVFFIFRS